MGKQTIIFLLTSCLISPVAYAFMYDAEDPLTSLIPKKAEEKTASTSANPHAVAFYQTAKKNISENKLNEALGMINQAIAIEPKNLDYLRKKMLIGLLLGDINLKNEASQAILTIKPNDQGALIAAAQYNNFKGKYKKSSENYENYLAYYPDDQGIRISFIKAILWSGDYKKAKKELEIYKQRYGEDEYYETERARYFGLSNQPVKAIEIVNEVLKKYGPSSDLYRIKKNAESRL